MAKFMVTNHKVVRFLGFKIIDIWDDYLERQIIGDEIITTGDIEATNDYPNNKNQDL